MRLINYGCIITGQEITFLSEYMKYPKVELYTENTTDFVAQYICFLAKGVSTSTYQNGGFLVLPNLESGFTKSVHFPDLPYSKDFWRSINFNPNINLSTQFPKAAVEEVKSLLAKKENTESTLYAQKMATEWKKIEKNFFNDLAKFLHLEKTLSKVAKIKILLTPYGTRGSFNPPRVGNEFNLMVTSRTDMPVGNIASGIMQNLYIIETKTGGEIGSDNYLKRMATINFLFTKTVFSKYYPNFADLTSPTFSTPMELVKKSKKYLTKLGFASIEINFDTEDGTFSKQESKLLKHLKKLNGELATFDEVANVIWGASADEKYSLEAMAKVIENLRKKIRESGIHKNVINTVRGKGYYFNS
jgi:hypothetical protein